MAFQALHLRFIRFLGPTKEPSEFTFTPGLNILWGSSDTGKTFLVEAIDFMLGASAKLRDIPERVGYDRILLGITTAAGKDYTLQRSIDGGSFRRYEGLLTESPADKKAGKNLSAIHTIKNYNNLSHWLLQEIGLDKRDILWSSASGENRSLGFRALAHLCLIIYPKITQATSPLYDGQYQDQTREYGVFKLLLTGTDDSAITPEVTAELEETKPVTKLPVRPEVLEQMIYSYEEELATLTKHPGKLDAEETAIDEELETLQSSMRTMEGQLSQTSQQRKDVYDRHSKLTARRNEITELQERFKLLDAQYTNDIKRLVAIEESGQLFILREPMACPLCGAQPQNQDHNAACDGNVAAVTQAAAAEIAKIRLLQAELHSTVAALTKEHLEIIGERKTLAGVWQSTSSRSTPRCPRTSLRPASSTTSLLRDEPTSDRPTSSISALMRCAVASMNRLPRHCRRYRRKRKIPRTSSSTSRNRSCVSSQRRSRRFSANGTSLMRRTCISMKKRAMW